MPTLSYAVLDVFAERALEGNPLAVFADGNGLSTAQMQAIAREMNLSETTFVLPRAEAEERASGVRVRIFTTREELPFAGHPTLGTASWLREHHPWLSGAGSVTLELNVGPIPVTFAPAEPGSAGVFATMRQNDPEFGPRPGTVMPPVEELAEALGLEPGDIGLAGAEHVPPEVVSTGSTFFVVPLRSLDVAHRLSIPQDRARPVLERAGARFFFCVTRAAQHAEAAWHGRMQFYGGEDPATGSAAGCVAAWLARHGLAASGQPTVMEQGVEVGRPSRLTLRATQTEVGVTDVLVGGRTIPVASGQLFLP